MRKVLSGFIVGFFLMMGVGQGFAQKLLLDEKNTINVFNRISPFVVNVHQVTDVPVNFWHSQQVATGAGSGFIWNKEGYIVTNFHVIEGAQQLAVTLYNQKPALANIIGVDRAHDIAVLKLDDTHVLPQLVNQA